MAATTTTPRAPAPTGAVRRNCLGVTWGAFLVLAFLALGVVDLVAWGLLVPLAAAMLAMATAPAARSVDWLRLRPDIRDLGVLAGL